MMEIIIMEDSKHRWNFTSNKELEAVDKFKLQLKELEQQNIRREIITRDTNSLNFYNITPKQELPKFLQKMRFKTLHLKEKDLTNSIKVFHKENRKPEEAELRKKLKEEGHLMLLSQIYQQLGESGESKNNLSMIQKHFTDLETDLDEWEKLRREQKFQQTMLIRKPRQKEAECKKNSERHCRNFIQGENYKGEVEKGLEIIDMTHSTEFNLMNRYSLIENSSKLLKQELDSRRILVEDEISGKMKALFEARTEYHCCFEERNKFKMEERLLEEEGNREAALKYSHKSLTNIRYDRSGQIRSHRKAQVENNEQKITQIKQNIQSLQQTIGRLEEELRSINIAEKIYYKNSLKIGNDVRETGLVWLIKKLDIKEDQMPFYQFPHYLDRRCRFFLFQKASSEQEAEQLLESKHRFVNQIGRTSNNLRIRKQFETSTPKRADRVVESELTEAVPKKYRKSLKKMTLLQEQYLKNTSLLQLWEQKGRGAEISADLQGMNNKQIYNQIGQRIKQMDLTKLKRDKMGTKKLKLIEYQSLLQKIKNVHIRMEEMDLQMESHLQNHYKDNRDLYFMQAAACFGYKRAHTLIIKHFSWKNYTQHH